MILTYAYLVLDAESIKNARKDWKKLKVLVTELEGHSDLVTSLSFAGNMIVTGRHV